VTPDAGAQPGELSPADGSGPRELLRYRSAQGRWGVAAMILGSSVAGIDSTVVVIALPAIGRNLHVGFGGLQWTVTSYTLTLASLILVAGSLSDRWGRRRVFLAGLGWFTLASVLCAAAPSIGWLIAARAVQGIGGALMTPASLAIIEAAFEPSDRARDRHMGGIQRGVLRDSALPRRVAAGSRQLAVDLPDQRPGRRGGRSQTSGRSVTADAPSPSRPG
jgi:Major Facilitator Superfamily